MGKVTKAVKKAVTKKPKEVKEEVKVPVVCVPCNGRGLESSSTLCKECHGSGTK